MAKITNTDGLILRAAASPDLGQISSIEQRSNPLPWSKVQLESSLSNHTVLLAEQNMQVLGVLIAQQVLDEASLLHLVVDSQHQSQGVGRFLLDSWLGSLPINVAKVWLEVRQTNLAAKQLYLKCGFTKAGTREGYYQHHLTIPSLKRETAEIFCLDLLQN